MGALAFLPVVSDLLKTLMDRVLPDPEKQAQMQLELAKMAANNELIHFQGEIQLAAGQLDTNKAEASSGSVFVAGWRPFIGWICGTGLGVQFVVSPLVTFILDFFGKHVVVPSLDLSTLMTLLFGMLGLGAYRTAEKIKGVSK